MSIEELYGKIETAEQNGQEHVVRVDGRSVTFAKHVGPGEDDWFHEHVSHDSCALLVDVLRRIGIPAERA